MRIYSLNMSYVKSININNLKIARENIGLSSFDTSKKMITSKKQKKDIVADWESGQSLPTWSQITKLAKVYNIPELILFSNESIKVNKVIPDYRVNIDQVENKNIRKLVNFVITRQKWLEHTLKEEGVSKNIIQGSGKTIDSPKRLADFIREKLLISNDEIKKIIGQDSRKITLKYLIQKAEDKGIFVGKTVSYHRLEVDDMRGLFVSNDYCPFIVLNRRDALSAQIFSFIHELAHLFRRSDAISNSLEFRTTDKKVNPEEVFCNQVAAELLLPESDFDQQYYNKLDIDNLSEIYKVSKACLFYRLKELGKISKVIQDDLEKQIKIETDLNLKKKAEQDKNKKGGDYYNAMKDSNGSLFNKVVSNSYLENKIGHTEASKLLRFSPELI